MLLRKSISSTKKFFQKTLQSFKSFFSGGYQRLPKTPPFNNPFSCGGDIDDMNMYSNYQELDKFYTDFTDQWDADKDEVKKGSKKNMISTATKEDREVYSGSFMQFAKASPMKNNKIEKREDQGKKRIVHERKKEEEPCTKGAREERSCLVAQKLKELEMMDVSNVDHVLDIEEVLHYYSRLTCPAYLDIVDKFFMDMHSEFFGPPASSYSNGSRLMQLRSVKL